MAHFFDSVLPVAFTLMAILVICATLRKWLGLGDAELQRTPKRSLRRRLGGARQLLGWLSHCSLGYRHYCSSWCKQASLDMYLTGGTRVGCSAAAGGWQVCVHHFALFL